MAHALGRSRRFIHTRDEIETYVEVTPRRNLWQLEIQRLFLPGSTVTDVGAKHVQVGMDAKTANGCTCRPRWIRGEVLDPESGRYWQSDSGG
jgi:hypothetical protein